MEDYRLPKIVMYGKLSTGHHERGAPKKQFKDSLKKSLTTGNIDHRQWSDLASDCVVWHHTIHQAAAQFEADRRNSLKDERQRRPPLPHQTLHFPAVTSRSPVSPTLVWSATSVPAVYDNVDKLHKSSFVKPSHDEIHS